MTGASKVENQERTATGRREEATAFFILAVLIWPVIAVAVVGGFGLLIWMVQLAFGPPGPPQ